ncbi:MAG: sulfatase family protein [Planctomycetota bacterium]|jgi:arylsulfatase A-like enzyme
MEGQSHMQDYSRRSFLKAIATGGIAFSTAPRRPVAAQSPRKPNIVFIIADDMKKHMFNCLPEGRGRNLSPNIDRLAAEGTLLMGQHVVSPVCTPSRFNCLTGRYASRSRSVNFLRSTRRHGQTVIGWNTHILADDVTLPRLLKQQGYKTGIVGKNHVVSAPGYEKLLYRADPMSPEAKARLAQNSREIKQALYACGFDYAASIYHNNPDGNGPRALGVHNLDWIVQGALDFIDENKDGPFFLYFASTVPHGPTTKDRSWGADPRITADGILDEPVNVLGRREDLPRRLKRAGIDQPGKENILWLDDAVGALIRRLERYGLDDNTIIFFFNDHGQDAKGTIYQGGVSNPSIVWRKGGFPCGPVSDALISNIDFAPTILDYAGRSVSRSDFDGRSFRPVLEATADKIHDSLYFEMGYTCGVLKGRWKYIALRYPEHARNMSLAERKRTLDRFNARQKERGKKVRCTDPLAPFSHISLIPGGGDAEAASTGKYAGYYDADQLYDLSADPGEQRNLINDFGHSEILREMKRELKKYLDQLPGGFAELKTERSSL